MSSKKKQKKKGIKPNLRFPEFSDAWNVPSLGEISERIVEKVGAQSLETISISAGVGFVSQAEKFSRDISGDQYKNYIVLNKGDFSYNKGNSKKFPQGCVYKLTNFERVAAPNAFISFKFKKDYISDFYQGYFESNFHGEQLKKFITSGARSNGLLNISPNDFFSIKLPTPVDRKEQKKIADCLSSLDELILAEERKLSSLRDHKKGLMQELFPGEDQALPRRRFPEFKNAPEWKEKCFSEIATFYNGRAYKQEELLDQGKYRVLRVGNLFTGNNWYYSDLELDETKYCESGDLLYAWSASFGPRIWHGDKVIYHYHIWKVIEKNATERDFLFILLEYETEKMKANSANGLGMLHITKGTIEGWKCRVPKPAEQKRIATFLSSVDDLVIIQSQKLDALRAQKKALIQRLFPPLSEVEK